MRGKRTRALQGIPGLPEPEDFWILKPCAVAMPSTQACVPCVVGLACSLRVNDKMGTDALKAAKRRRKDRQARAGISNLFQHLAT